MSLVTMNNKQKFNFVPKSRRQTNVAGQLALFKFSGTADETLTVPIACEVIDVHCVMTGAGAASDTVTLKKGTDAITDVIDVSSAGDKDIVRAGEIDDAFSTLAEGDSLFCDRASAANCDVWVWVELHD